MESSDCQIMLSKQKIHPGIRLESRFRPNGLSRGNEQIDGPAGRHPFQRMVILRCPVQRRFNTDMLSGRPFDGQSRVRNKNSLAGPEPGINIPLKVVINDSLSENFILPWTHNVDRNAFDLWLMPLLVPG